MKTTSKGSQGKMASPALLSVACQVPLGLWTHRYELRRKIRQEVLDQWKNPDLAESQSKGIWKSQISPPSIPFTTELGA